MKYPKIISVKPTSDYNVILTLENGIIKKFDVKPYISGTWFGELKDKDIFNTVHPCGNTIEWKDGQDIAPHELHELSVFIENWANNLWKDW